MYSKHRSFYIIIASNWMVCCLYKNCRSLKCQRAVVRSFGIKSSLFQQLNRCRFLCHGRGNRFHQITTESFWRRVIRTCDGIHISRILQYTVYDMQVTLGCLLEAMVWCLFYNLAQNTTDCIGRSHHRQRGPKSRKPDGIHTFGTYEKLFGMLFFKLPANYYRSVYPYLPLNWDRTTRCVRLIHRFERVYQRQHR